jgi:hypothetical protein
VDSLIPLDEVRRLAPGQSGHRIAVVVAPSMGFLSGGHSGGRAPAPLDAINAGHDTRPVRGSVSHGGAWPPPALGAGGRRH